MSRYRSPVCEEYTTFATCNHVQQCRDLSREEDLWRSEYFLGEIDGIRRNEFTIIRFLENDGTTKERFVVDNLTQYQRHTTGRPRQNETEGQLIVFQASEKKKCGLRCGRVVLVLGQATDSRRPRCDVEVAAELDVFILFPVETTAYRNAFSFTKCTQDHGRECQMIGIHTSAMAWGLDKPLTDIPSFGPRIPSLRRVMERGSKTLSHFGLFETRKQALAISVYVHSKDVKHPEGPVFTPVRVIKNLTFAEFSRRQRQDLRLACSVFNGDELQKLPNRGHFWHLVACNEPYPVRFFVNDALKAHVRQTTNYFQGSIREYAFATRKEIYPGENIIQNLIADQINENENELCFVADHYLNQAQCNKTAHEAANWLSCNLQIMTFPETMKQLYKNKRFTTEIVAGREAASDHLFCIFGQKEASFLVNQQLLIQSMLGLSYTMYERVDLIGISARRFPEPKISKCIIRKMDSECIHLHHMDQLWIHDSLMKLSYSEMGNNSPTLTNNYERVELVWGNFHCDEIEYDKVFRVNTADVRRCFSELSTSQNPSSALGQLERVEMDPPFSVSSAGELKFTPVPRMIVRLQICDTVPHHPIQVRFRMIILGRNGHICLAHMNSPQKMFSAHNENVLSIDNLTEASKISKIYPTESNRVIKWKGKYNGGGWFKTELPVKKGHLLCIRKDIYEDDKVKYVWNAHGVVDEDQKDDGEVSFSVCSLSQPGETTESDGFVIEYIDDISA